MYIKQQQRPRKRNCCRSLSLIYSCYAPSSLSSISACVLGKYLFILLIKVNAQSGWVRSTRRRRRRWGTFRGTNSGCQLHSFWSQETTLKHERFNLQVSITKRPIYWISCYQTKTVQSTEWEYQCHLITTNWWKVIKLMAIKKWKRLQCIFCHKQACMLETN